MTHRQQLGLGTHHSTPTASRGGCESVWEENFWANPSPVRAHLLEIDPGLNQRLISSGTTVAQLFNQDMWERHRQPGRYLLYMTRMVHSTVLRRIFRPCAAAAGIAALVGLINTLLPASWPRLGMSLVPHTLLGAALSLLLVFRTNSSFARFVEGRALWGALVRYSRDWTRLAAYHFPGELRGRAARYIQVLAFVLKSHLRAGRFRATPSDPTAFRDDPSVVVKELLPCNEATEVLAQSNRPFYMICKLTSLVREASRKAVARHVLLQASWLAAAPLWQAGWQALEHTISELCAVIGGCDRILGTPIPLSYTRHTSRSLVLWLSTLPLALWPVTEWLSVPAMFIIAFVFIGIDEIGSTFSQPLPVLRMAPMPPIASLCAPTPPTASGSQNKEIPSPSPAALNKARLLGGDFGAYINPDFHVEGAESGPLHGLKVALKDMYAVQGYRCVTPDPLHEGTTAGGTATRHSLAYSMVDTAPPPSLGTTGDHYVGTVFCFVETGFGNPSWRATHGPATRTAPVVMQLLAAGASIAGLAHMDELAYSLNVPGFIAVGENMHYGTPTNPAAPGHIPGGSSSGTAVCGAVCNREQAASNPHSLTPSEAASLILRVAQLPPLLGPGQHGGRLQPGKDPGRGGLVRAELLPGLAVVVTTREHYVGAVF
ncbi:hypothetical protein QJQ45_023475 [Haematococcus lacustris]|nr:hypothetical protein QJQ45_023475 [Haematococcus lacustris]